MKPNRIKPILTGDGEENVVTAGMFVHESADVINLSIHLC